MKQWILWWKCQQELWKNIGKRVKEDCSAPLSRPRMPQRVNPKAQQKLEYSSYLFFSGQILSFFTISLIYILRFVI
jgi:hypothetical protein